MLHERCPPSCDAALARISPVSRTLSESLLRQGVTRVVSLASPVLSPCRGDVVLKAVARVGRPVRPRCRSRRLSSFRRRRVPVSPGSAVVRHYTARPSRRSLPKDTQSNPPSISVTVQYAHSTPTVVSAAPAPPLTALFVNAMHAARSPLPAACRRSEDRCRLAS